MKWFLSRLSKGNHTLTSDTLKNTSTETLKKNYGVWFDNYEAIRIIICKVFV